MSLQWVDQCKITADARRRIRSHVMKGKNAGRPRPERKPLKSDRGGKRQLSHGSHTISDSESRTSHQALLRYYTKPGTEQLFWNDLCLASFAEIPSSESVRFIHQWFVVTESVYPSAFCSRLDIMAYIWYYYIHIDIAYFHSVLAITASFSDVFGGKRGVSREALRHVTRAYRIVNQKLQSHESLSDTTIATVITLALYQRVHHQQQTGLIHLYGLLRMIEMRGGIEVLQKQNRALAQKALRLDIEFALQDGQPTRLLIEEKRPSPNTTRLEISQTLKSALAVLERKHCVSPELLNIMCRCAALASRLNKLDAGSKLDPLDFSDQILSLTTSLLRHAPIQCPDPRNKLERFIHLSLLALMTTLLPAYGRDHYQYNLLAIELERALMDMHGVVGLHHTTMVWAIFVGKVSVLRDRDGRRFLELLRESLSQLRLHTWGDVLQMLSEYPWIHAIHDVAGKKYWTETIKGRKKS